MRIIVGRIIWSYGSLWRAIHWIWKYEKDDHPLLPNIIMFAGVGATVSYEPDPDESILLNYSRNQIKDTISEVIDVYG